MGKKVLRGVNELKSISGEHRTASISYYKSLLLLFLKMWYNNTWSESLERFQDSLQIYRIKISGSGDGNWERAILYNRLVDSCISPMFENYYFQVRGYNFLFRVCAQMPWWWNYHIYFQYPQCLAHSWHVVKYLLSGRILFKIFF